MNVRSLALTTDLALHATRGRVTDRGNYLVVETPDDPGYYYGNLLVLPVGDDVVVVIKSTEVMLAKD